MSTAALLAPMPVRRHVDDDTETPPPAREPEIDTEDMTFEVVHGELVETPKMGMYAAIIASRLSTALNRVAVPNRLGEAVVEVLFRLPLAYDQSRRRRPDVAFVSAERWPIGLVHSPEVNAWDVVPDLAVEVVSPTDDAEELYDKVQEYFRAGVRLVWVVFPKHAHFHVYETPTSIRVRTREETLDGGPVLAGFLLPLVDLFDAPASTSTPPATSTQGPTA